jgi:ElaA protein
VPIGARAQLEWRDFADFTADALYDLLRFRQAIFVVEQSSPFPDLDGLDRRAHHLLLQVDGALAGYLRLIPYPLPDPPPVAGEGWVGVAIGRVAVAIERRRRGFARKLMQEALARCRRDHPGLPIAVSAQSYLAPFYRSLGFRPVSPPYDDYGVPHIDMIRAPERRPYA